MRWIYENVLLPRHIPLGRVLVMGDEFGPVGSLPGSDSLMCIPELKNAAFLSVGPEPGGVPKGILHVPGGPDAFILYLGFQIKGRVDDRLGWKESRPTGDATWLLEQVGFDPTREREMETLFTIGNGHLGIRGGLLAPIPISQADLIVSGIYSEKIARFPYLGTEIVTPEREKNPYTEIVTLPFPFRFIPSVSISEDNGFRITQLERTLDIKRAMLFESYIFEDHQGKCLSVRSVRWASLSEPQMCFQEMEVMPLNFAGQLTIDACPVTKEMEQHHPHLVRLPSEAATEGEWNFETRASKFQISMGMRLWVDGERHSSLQWEQPISRGEFFRFRRAASIFTSRESKRPIEDVREALSGIDWKSYDKKLEEHGDKWSDIWKRVDIRFGNDSDVTHAERFNLYHLLIAAPRSDENSIPAKGLTGRGYEGHIFWDTEVFILPFLLYSFPEWARQALLYRHATLDGARERARGMGCTGACFAWESTVDGRDMTPGKIVLKTAGVEIPIFTGIEQIHVTADVAAAIFKYWELTLDEPFLADYGTEVLIETARFWSTRCTEEKGRFHLLKVLGPDEYHHSVDDNAYTNWMARFNLSTAVWAANRMQDKWKDKWEALCSRIKVTKDSESNCFGTRSAFLLSRAELGGSYRAISRFFRPEENAASKRGSSQSSLEPPFRLARDQ